eukprot:12249470-Alexandrium_andersonii.AAC.1
MAFVLLARKLKSFLVIYVDDFKLAGPAGSLADGWKLLRKGLSIEPEQRCDEDGATDLGCKITRGSTRLPGGRLAT